MDIITNLISAQESNASQATELFGNNLKTTSLAPSEDTAKAYNLEEENDIDKGEILPFDGNLSPKYVHNAIFNDVLKENILQFKEENSLSDNNISENDFKDDKQELAELFAISNDFLFVEKEQFTGKNIYQQNDLIVTQDNQFPEIAEKSNLEKSTLLSNNTPIVIVDEKPNQVNELKMAQIFNAQEMQSAMKNVEAENISSEEKVIDIEMKEELLPSDDLNQSSKESQLEQNQRLLSQNATQSYNQLKLIMDQQDTDNQPILNDKKDINKVTIDDPTFNSVQTIVNNDTLRKEHTQIRNNVDTYISSHHFEEDLTQQVQIMINSNENSAKVTIDPPELGHIEIKIVQDVDKTHIMFLASHEQTHDLIESSLSKLKFHMESQGIDIGNVTVSHGESHHRQHQFSKQNATKENEFSKEVENIQYVLKPSNNNGLLDLYV